MRLLCGYCQKKQEFLDVEAGVACSVCGQLSLLEKDGDETEIQVRSVLDVESGRESDEMGDAGGSRGGDKGYIQLEFASSWDSTAKLPNPRDWTE